MSMLGLLSQNCKCFAGEIACNKYSKNEIACSLFYLLNTVVSFTRKIRKKLKRKLLQFTCHKAMLFQCIQFLQDFVCKLYCKVVISGNRFVVAAFLYSKIVLLSFSRSQPYFIIAIVILLQKQI